jgi:hypothetical protein
VGYLFLRHYCEKNDQSPCVWGKAGGIVTWMINHNLFGNLGSVMEGLSNCLKAGERPLLDFEALSRNQEELTRYSLDPAVYYISTS